LSPGQKWVRSWSIDQGISVDEAALALSAAKGLAGLKTHGTAAETLRRLAKEYRLSSVAAILE
jgi:hypothetical protein